MDLFSHQPKVETVPLPATKHHTHAVFAELSSPFEEIWQGFTAYTHLWWPQQLRQEPTSHIEISSEYLLEQNEDGENTLLGQTVHYVPGDVVAVRFHEETAPDLHAVFPNGLSFTFDIGDAKLPSIVEVSTGILAPREISADADLGLAGEPATGLAEHILSAFARFMGKTQAVKVEEL